MTPECICQKTEPFCLCSVIEIQDHSIPIMILRHPQEKKKVSNTASLAVRQFKHCEMKTGLSWKNLESATGTKTKNWAVLYPGSKAITTRVSKMGPGAYVHDRDEIEPLVAKNGFDGIICLDGNWAQSKTLWWRNPWLKRLKKIILNPKQPSAFNNVLREPRKNFLTTAESIAYLIEILENNEDSLIKMRKYLKEFESRLTAQR